MKEKWLQWASELQSMAKEKIDGAWSLPGGWADVNTNVFRG